MDLNLDNIKFLNESVAVNEGILFSTKGGRQKASRAIARIDKAVGAYLTYLDNSSKIIYEMYKKFFSGDLVLNLKKRLSMLENANERLKKELDGCKLALDEIKGDYKGNIFSDMLKRKFFNRADLKSEPVSREYSDLIKKCSPGGEYYQKCLDLYNILETNLRPLFSNTLSDKIRGARLEFERGSKEITAINDFLDYCETCTKELKYTVGDINYISRGFKNK